MFMLDALYIFFICLGEYQIECVEVPEDNLPISMEFSPLCPTDTSCYAETLTPIFKQIESAFRR
jgi:hypothetical protein